MVTIYIICVKLLKKYLFSYSIIRWLDKLNLRLPRVEKL